MYQRLQALGYQLKHCLLFNKNFRCSKVILVVSNVRRVEILAPQIELSSALRVQKSTGVYWFRSNRSRLGQLRILMRTDDCVELFNFCLFFGCFSEDKTFDFEKRGRRNSRTRDNEIIINNYSGAWWWIFNIHE